MSFSAAAWFEDASPFKDVQYINSRGLVRRSTASSGSSELSGRRQSFPGSSMGSESPSRSALAYVSLPPLVDLLGRKLKEPPAFANPAASAACLKAAAGRITGSPAQTKPSRSAWSTSTAAASNGFGLGFGGSSSSAYSTRSSKWQAPSKSAQSLQSSEAEATDGTPHGGVSVRARSLPPAVSPKTPERSSSSSGFGAQRPGPPTAGAPQSKQPKQLGPAGFEKKMLSQSTALRFSDFPDFLDTLDSIDDDRLQAKLMKNVQVRASELLAQVKVSDLQRAKRLLLTLPVEARRVRSSVAWKPDLASAPEERGGGEDLLRWECPTKTFEDRIVHLSFQNSHDLDSLRECYSTARQLRDDGLVSEKTETAISERIVSWIRRTPLKDFPKFVQSMQELALVMPLSEQELKRRVTKRAGEAFLSSKQFSGFANLVLQLEAQHMEVLDDPGREVLDHPSAAKFPAAQLALLSALRTLVKDRSIDWLGDELEGPVLKLFCSRKRLKDKSTIVLSERLTVELNAIRDMIMRRGDAVKVQEHLLSFCRFVLVACSADGGKVNGNGRGLIDLPEPLRMHLLGATTTLGSLGFCAASVTPGAPELPPEYRGRIPVLAMKSEELWQRVARIMVALGDDDEVKVAEPLVKRK
mmetsp:Transcript_66037/g.143249  ORF Transcript_66037/g.143249 Transcript_66037/m.143249 type:complete len:640 (+) Transcript_66037:72-1991(+)|eukprot:CAMPEP_0206423542 /NCGR_PEP_ID=MMETSP0324_2-20121206/2735_1 /ASSEMBLY_ACC=CAM_ASM_000836 /TAXON_ID=2866 /ORGANISM="Crypthecodinium cohnii, Strain Seligo" /LENGTH=639 /DNA_ID=CAMNT_0053888107 /DNA_START=51 /DNA_END=1970 /DNA_ORIENTATION=-